MENLKTVDQWHTQAFRTVFSLWIYIKTETVRFRSSISLFFIKMFGIEERKRRNMQSFFFSCGLWNWWAREPKNDRMLVLMVLPTRVIHMQQKTNWRMETTIHCDFIFASDSSVEVCYSMIFLGCILIFRLFCLSLSLAPWSLLASWILNNSILHEIGWPFSQPRKKKHEPKNPFLNQSL